jgi:hypothetical protein
LTGTLCLVAGLVSGARADSSTSLGQLSNFQQIIVDSAAGYVFLSEGGSAYDLVTAGPTAMGGIVVTDLAGSYVTTLDAGDEVEGMALSADGGTLYAALAATDSVGVIDTATLTQTTQYSLGSGTADPYSIAVQSGKLWVGYNTAKGAGLGAIGDFDLATPNPPFVKQPLVVGSWYYAPDLGADPSNTGKIVATQIYSNGAVYDITTDPITLQAKSASLYGCGTWVYMLPGGAQFISCGTEYNAADFSVQRSFPDGGGLGNALSPDGTVVAMGGSSGFAQDVYVYQSSGGSGNDLRLTGTKQLAWNGLAISATGALYLVVTDQSTGAYSLRIYDQPTATHATLALSAAASGIYGNTVKLAGTLTLSQGTLPAGTRVSIARTLNGNSSSPLTLSAAVSAKGSFALTDMPRSPGTYTYTASFPGNVITAAAAATVKVKLITTVLDMSPPESRVTPGKRFTIGGALFLNGAAAGVPVTVTRSMAGTATVRFTAKTDKYGNFAVSDVLTRLGTYRYVAHYAGTGTTTSATRATTAAVQLPLPSLGVKMSAATIAYHQAFTLTAHLGASGTNRTLAIYAQTNGTGPKRLLKRGQVDAHGNLAVNLGNLAQNTMFWVYFTGDASYAPQTAWRKVWVHVLIGMKVSGYFGTKKVDGYPAYVFHHTSDLAAAISVTPNKHGQCVKLEVQQYVNSTWEPNSTFGCFYLNASSKAAVALGLTNAAGALYAVQADYFQTSKDTTNISTDGEWVYFDVVN